MLKKEREGEERENLKIWSEAAGGIAARAQGDLVRTCLFIDVALMCLIYYLLP